MFGLLHPQSLVEPSMIPWWLSVRMTTACSERVRWQPLELSWLHLFDAPYLMICRRLQGRRDSHGPLVGKQVQVGAMQVSTAP